MVDFNVTEVDMLRRSNQKLIEAVVTLIAAIEKAKVRIESLEIYAFGSVVDDTE